MQSQRKKTFGGGYLGPAMRKITLVTLEFDRILAVSSTF